MTLRVRTISFIIPIFLGISIFLGVLKYNTEKREIEWGVKEYISSLSEAIFQFTSARKVRAYFTSPENNSLKSIQTIADWNPNLKALWLIKTNKSGDKKLIFGTNVGKDLDPIEVDDFNVELGNDSDYSFIVHSAKSSEFKWGLVIDTSEAREKLEKSVAECFIFGSIISLFGLFISLVISGILKNNFFYLNQGAKKVIAGDYKQVVSKRSSIQEIIDLGNTFDTMRNVLSDFLERIQRRSIDEQADSKSLMLPIKNYNSIIWKNRREVAHGFIIRLEFINMSSFVFNQNFGSIFSSKGKTYAFIGKVDIKSESNDFSENVSTSLVKILFENSLERGLTVEEAISQVENIFKIKQFFCFEISPKKNVALYNLYSSQGTKEVKKDKIIFSERAVSHSHVHTFDSEAGKALNKVISHIKTPDPFSIQLFVKQISEESGGLLLLHPK